MAEGTGKASFRGEIACQPVSTLARQHADTGAAAASRRGEGAPVRRAANTGITCLGHEAHGAELTELTHLYQPALKPTLCGLQAIELNRFSNKVRLFSG